MRLGARRSAARRLGGGLALVALASFTLSAQAPPGKAIYDTWCAGCHGDTGAGDGYAAALMLPRPRDFTRGVFQVRTTASGELPTDSDLRRVVDEGMPGTAMPEWKSRLSEQERADVIGYLKTFSRFFQGGAAPQALGFGKPPGRSEAGIAEGREVFRKLECFKCHGQGGRGDGTSAPTLKDDWGHPIRATDLTKSWNFNGGSSVEEIYARLRTGLDGTPMPSFSDALEAKVVTEEQLWRLAQYVRSLSPEQPPEGREVIRARLIPGKLPSGPGDSLWAQVEPAYVPLVGQIIQKPRWFLPTVDAVWVQALHDGTRLALRLVWHDPSQSPDSAWDEWLGRIVQTASDADEPIPTIQGPDRLVLQMPKQVSEDAERPYFLQGSARRPVYLVRWISDSDRVEEGVAMGLGHFTPQAASSRWIHAARFENGEWQLQLVGPLVPTDSSAAPAFHPGQAIPIALFAADGSNGEGEVRGSVSAWYSIYLEVPVPVRVYVEPVVAGLLTVGLGILVIYRAQRREPRVGSSNLEG
ncbi:MAG: c-type cytochrome [Gemmatimonadales bacterium]